LAAIGLGGSDPGPASLFSIHYGSALIFEVRENDLSAGAPGIAFFTATDRDDRCIY